MAAASTADGEAVGSNKQLQRICMKWVCQLKQNPAHQQAVCTKRYNCMLITTKQTVCQVGVMVTYCHSQSQTAQHKCPYVARSATPNGTCCIITTLHTKPTLTANPVQHRPICTPTMNSLCADRLVYLLRAVAGDQGSLTAHTDCLQHLSHGAIGWPRACGLLHSLAVLVGAADTAVAQSVAACVVVLVVCRRSSLGVTGLALASGASDCAPVEQAVGHALGSLAAVAHGVAVWHVCADLVL